MYVCLCTGLTNHDIRQAIASGASSVEEVTGRTGAGTHCGACVASVKALVASADDVPRRKCRRARAHAA
jgi:bacterioferritin-associated ferredoxin